MQHHFIILASLLALAACGKSEETITVKDDSGEAATAVATAAPDGKSNTTTIKADGVEMTMSQGGKVDFPGYAPQYPGSTIGGSTTSKSNDGKSSQTFELKTADKPADVMAFYKAKLIAGKRAIAMETSTPEGGMIMSDKDADGVGVVVNVEVKNDTTVATIISSKGY
jgi:hypothetical protein